MSRPIDLRAAAGTLTTPWSPRVVAALNDHRVKVARLEGTFTWHQHDIDELFLVLEGRLAIDLRDGGVELSPGQLFVVPAGVEHCPRTLDPHVLVALIEPAGVVNTGDADPNELTADVDAWL